MEDDHPIVPRAEGDPRLPLERHRQHGEPIVVGVLTDEIHPSGSPDEVAWRPTEVFLEGARYVGHLRACMLSVIT